MRFGYPCPDCRATSDLHSPNCRFEGRSWSAVEKAYVDVLSVLAAGPYHATENGEPTGDDGGRPIEEERLREVVHGEWDALHAAVVESLLDQGRVRSDGGLVLRTPEEFREEMADPDRDPLKTIHEKGSVPGCHDNAVFAMIAWYEMVGFTWEETRERTVEWLRESGTWARGGFEETSPEQLVEKKRHVYERGYGWKEKAQAAKRVIDRSL